METGALTPIVIDPKTFLYEHCVLPALPKVLSQFQEALQQPDVSIGRVVTIISRDPGVVAEVLKVVNSAYYNLPREVSRLDMAVAYLGIQEVYNIVLAASVLRTFNLSEPALFKQIWHHSLYTALIARYLANKFERHIPSADLWAPALLHDVGKIVYLKFFTEHYKAIKRYAEEHGCLISEALKVHGLPSTAYLGDLLCLRWGLPGTVRTVCAGDQLLMLDALDRGEDIPEILRITTLADAAAILTTEPLKKEKQLHLTEILMSAFELTETEFLVLMGAVEELKLEADRLAS